MSPSRPRHEALAQLLTPKWVALTVLVVAMSAVFAFASSWQYSRAMHQVDAQRAAASLPVAVDQLVPAGDQVPSGSLGRLAVVQGRYATHAWVTGRTSATGERGFWLVSGVDDGSGLLTAVLRGWLPAKEVPEDIGRVEVVGRVSSEENFYRYSASSADDEMAAINDARLAGIWGQPLRPGYVVLTEQDPQLGPGDPQPVPAVFGTDASVGFPWQNAGYALQWLTFIAFVGFMYWRFFRDDLHASREQAPVGADVH